jgi:replicative DNA helicase
MLITQKRIDTVSEQNLLTGLIVSDLFCRQLLPIIRPEFFQIEYSIPVVQWIKNHYSQYEKAPKGSIQEIFLAEKRNINYELSEGIEIFLKNLSEKFEKQESFNEEYLLDQSVKYVKQRALLYHADLVRALAEEGKEEEAELEIVNYKKVSKQTSDWVNPFDEKVIEEFFLRQDEYLLKLPGIMGELFGGLKRTWLTGIMAPPKVGKTFFLVDTAVAALSNRLKTAFFTLEMQDYEVASRTYKRITALTEEKGDIFIPTFDCVRNQNDSCNRPDRVCHIGLLQPNGDPPLQGEEPEGYLPCVICRLSRDFIAAVWYRKETKQKITMTRVKKKAKGMATMYGKDMFRVLSYPIGTANLGDIKNDLEVLEYSEDFIPDVVIVDYADILKPENTSLVGREAINETWKGLKSLAQDRHCLVVTATQANRESIGKKNVRQTHVSEDIRKLAHVDIFGVLNQTAKEKRKGVIRIGIIARRHGESDEGVQALAIQSLQIGQPFLDDVYFRGEIEE